MYSIFIASSNLRDSAKIVSLNCWVSQFCSVLSCCFSIKYCTELLF